LFFKEGKVEKRKKFPLVYFLVLTAFLVTAGCQEDVTSTGNPPTISNLRISPQTAGLGQANSTIAVSILVDFEDPDGDLFALVLLNADGTFAEIPFSSESNETQGTVGASINLSTAEAGTTELVIGVEDANGNISDALTGTFTVG